ncbi:MAG: hypothetical protein QNI89_02385 [Desulfobacterales bacterium]|nr:hypothetical protein [Desulfobacterales bacterium]MDJ0854355.1 hypothetical protein [Desulfobacterales bacterium]MDJ0886115.1 hypothetical protein [Desulfobacterales bacterium]MDJ0990905.1 hypothetical protein [Desulfobacterales bacterium]
MFRGRTCSTFWCGYLISQFLSTYANQRRDGYGGSLENRFRLAHEIIAAMRPVVPRERLLTFRISDWGVAYTQEPLP